MFTPDEMHEFLTKIAENNVVYISSAEYLSKALGWPLKDTHQVFNILLTSGRVDKPAGISTIAYRIN